MMVIVKEDLGLSLSLSCTTPTTTTTTTTPTTAAKPAAGSTPHDRSNYNRFAMMLGRTHDNNNNHHQTTPFSSSNHNNSKPTASPSLQLNLMRIPPPTAATRLNTTTTTNNNNNNNNSFLHKLQRIKSTDSYPPSRRLFLRGIDVNRPAGGGEDDEAGASSPNSTVSSVSGKRSLCERDYAAADDMDAERASSRGLSDDEDGGDNSRKKLRLTKDQAAVLEDSFKEHNTLNPKQKLALAKRLGLRPRQVEVWFQNRRARTKLKQTEVDCEFLKRCCEQLTEENRRLQKEVQELRTIKLSPQFYMQMTPPTTLTMCPSCERVATPTSSTPGSVHSKPRPPVAESRPNTNTIRPVVANPWVAGPGPIRSFDVLRPRN